MQIYGIGTNIVECLRIAKMIERYGENFICRIYTDHEIQHCRAKAFATQQYAGHWAAKEAVMKAMGTGWVRGISWRDIEIYSEPAGKQIVRLAGQARTICEEKGISDVLISISHCRTHATAFATAMTED